MIKIFVLEDNVERIKIFKDWFSDIDELMIVSTARDAIEILSDRLDWDIVFLDHDLGGQTYVNVEEYNTGSTVAKFLSDKDISGEIIIHTMNTSAANNMMSYLPKARYMPFWTLILNKPRGWIQ